MLEMAELPGMTGMWRTSGIIEIPVMTGMPRVCVLP